MDLGALPLPRRRRRILTVSFYRSGVMNPRGRGPPAADTQWVSGGFKKLNYGRRYPAHTRAEEQEERGMKRRE